MEEQNFISSASMVTTEEPTEVRVDPGSKDERVPWVKKNLTKILCGIIAILGFSLITVTGDWYKEHQENMRRKNSLHWLAYQHKYATEERDFYSKLTKDLNYYKFVKTIYEAKDRDFFETITIAYNESIRQNVNPWETLSIIGQESGFKQYIVSQITVKVDGQLKKIPCAYGLMQVYYDVWKDEKDLNMTNIFDKETNIRVGLEIYNYYLDMACGDKFLALFYYNNGPFTIPAKQNHNYAPAVMKSKYMKLAVNYDPIPDVERTKGMSQ